MDYAAKAQPWSLPEIQLDYFKGITVVYGCPFIAHVGFLIQNLI